MAITVSKPTQDIQEQRLDRLITEARQLLTDAIAEHVHGVRRKRGGRPYELAGIAILYSGGNDSTVLAHLFRDLATTAIHANTGIGIEATRQFVRDTCTSWGLPLIEKIPPVSYRDLVIERGFPGPGQHYKMYQRLKERCIREAKNDITQGRTHSTRTVFLAGRRSTESDRRWQRAKEGQIAPVEVVESTVWVSPLHNWTALDLNAYRRRFPDVPRNEVSDHLHMSGECLCGAFAKPGELDEIGFFYPEVKAGIEALERDVAAAGNVPAEQCRWGWGANRDRSGAKSGRMCSSCAFDQPELPLDVKPQPRGWANLSRDQRVIEANRIAASVLAVSNA